jgi:predicted metal-binding membrane protein
MNALTITADTIDERKNLHALRRFIAIAALVFIASLLATYAMHASMSSMSELPMPGGWMLSPGWTPMCGRTWLRAAASFIGMWIAMMTSMMLPSFAPVLWRYRETLRRAGTRRTARHASAMAAGYVCAWTAIGLASFVLGAAFAELALRMPAVARAVPFAGGAVVLLAGALQMSAWKADRLACCREGVARHVMPREGLLASCVAGLRHGLHCACCCAPLTAALFVFGVMDLRAMMLVTVAVTAERVAGSYRSVARGIGVALLALGCLMIAGYPS